MSKWRKWWRPKNERTNFSTHRSHPWRISNIYYSSSSQSLKRELRNAPESFVKTLTHAHAVLWENIKLFNGTHNFLVHTFCYMCAKKSFPSFDWRRRRISLKKFMLQNFSFFFGWFIWEILIIKKVFFLLFLTCNYCFFFVIVVLY